MSDYGTSAGTGGLGETNAIPAYSAEPSWLEWLIGSSAGELLDKGGAAVSSIAGAIAGGSAAVIGSAADAPRQVAEGIATVISAEGQAVGSIGQAASDVVGSAGEAVGAAGEGIASTLWAAAAAVVAVGGALLLL